MDTPVATGPQAVIDRLLAEPRIDQLPALRHALLLLEDEFDVTLPSHMEGSVTLTALRLYARV